MSIREQLSKINKGLNNLAFTPENNMSLVLGFRIRFENDYINRNYGFRQISTKQLEDLKTELCWHLEAARITEAQWREAIA